MRTIKELLTLLIDNFDDCYRKKTGLCNYIYDCYYRSGPCKQFEMRINYEEKELLLNLIKEHKPERIRTFLFFTRPNDEAFWWRRDRPRKRFLKKLLKIYS